jgi:type VI secretion system protein ImpL
MMQKFWLFLTQRRTLIVIGWLAFAALLFITAALLQWPASVPWTVLAITLAFGAIVWYWRYRKRQRAAGKLGDMLEQQASKPVKADPASARKPKRCARACWTPSAPSRIPSWARPPATPRCMSCRGT